MKRRNVWIPLAMLAAAALVVIVAAAAGSSSDDADSGPDDVAHVREDSHRLSDAPPDAPVFVEFLDFECEACGAVFPAIEAMRERYGDEIQFVARYFPLPGHPNSGQAARAAEAAARQGEFEAMYVRLFETQESWSHRNEPQDEVFRGFAEELGLDLDQFDADYNDPATVERIEVDKADGFALGVNGTPTFFLDGELIEPQTLDELIAAFDAAINS